MSESTEEEREQFEEEKLLKTRQEVQAINDKLEEE